MTDEILRLEALKWNAFLSEEKKPVSTKGHQGPLGKLTTKF